MKQIPLTRGLYAVVDDADFEMLSQWKWYAQKAYNTFYAARRDGHGGSLIFMHRLLAKTPAGLKTDHVDGDGLNNQRHNLRPATNSQNGTNIAARGAWKDPSVRNRKQWRSCITVDGRKVYLGRFATAEEAEAAYAAAAVRHYGEFQRFTGGHAA